DPLLLARFRLNAQTLLADEAPTTGKASPEYRFQAFATAAGSVTRRQDLPVQCSTMPMGFVPLLVTAPPTAQASLLATASTPVSSVSSPLTETLATVRQPVVVACAGSMPPTSATALPAKTSAARREVSLIMNPLDALEVSRGDKIILKVLSQ